MSLLWGWNNQHRNTSTRPCDPMRLTTGGKLVYNESYSVTLTQDIIFEPPCTVDTSAPPQDPSTILDFHEAFYASTSPQMYAIAVATVLCYVLVIILFITPRTYFVGGRGGGFLGRHGMISGSYGSASVVGVGGRPWLQKVAALTGAISLTIATADSFEVAKTQYYSGYMDSQALTNEVVNGLVIRIVRIISGTFLWLAQVQTLIRLFPRHKEKVIIKWVGFALIVLDTLFSILNGFISPQSNFIQRGSIAHAIPALNYLFEFSLSLLYAAWVIFYSISKHRFAFFHVKMRNIFLVALLSLAAILIPVIFFIVDVTKPNVAGWGEYIRWVGAAAASVVVWEWVERIEALEREERKGGILGREVFDGDEMLEATPSKEAGWPGSVGGPRDGGGKGGSSGSSWFSGGSSSHFRRLFHRRAPFRSQRRKRRRHSDISHLNEEILPNVGPAPPPNAITPISREGTTSAASTIYRVRYHSVSSPTPSSPDISPGGEQDEKGLPSVSSVLSKDTPGTTVYNNLSSAHPRKWGTGWLSAANPFKRRRASPPQEVATAQAEEGNIPNVTRNEPTEQNQRRWNLRRNYDWVTSLVNRDIGDSSTGNRPSEPPILPVTVIPVRSRRALSVSARPAENPAHSRPRRSNTNERKMTESPLPVMVIPAQPRSSRTWSAQATDDSRLPTFTRGLTETPSNIQSPSSNSPEATVANHGNRATQQDGRVRWHGEDERPSQWQSHSAPPELHNDASEREEFESAHQSDILPSPPNDQHSIEEQPAGGALGPPSRASHSRSSPDEHG